MISLEQDLTYQPARHQFAIRYGAFGLTVSPTAMGKRVALVIEHSVKSKLDKRP
jgi:hypothetical protein